MTTQLDHAALDADLRRYRFLFPLSLSLFITATVLVTLFYYPNAAQVSDDYRTVLTPLSVGVGAYWGVISMFQIGQAVLMLRYESLSIESKDLLLHTVAGLRLPAVALCMTGWTFAWSLRLFFIAELCLLLAMLFTGSLCLSLFKYEKSTAGEAVRKSVYGIVSIPIKMIFVIMISVDIWQGGLLALGYYRYVGPVQGEASGSRFDYNIDDFACVAVIGIALVNSIITSLYADVTFSLSAIYVALVLLYQTNGKSGPLLTSITFGIIGVMVTLFGSMGWRIIRVRRQRRSGVVL